MCQEGGVDENVDKGAWAGYQQGPDVIDLRLTWREMENLILGDF